MLHKDPKSPANFVDYRKELKDAAASEDWQQISSLDKAFSEQVESWLGNLAPAEIGEAHAELSDLLNDYRVVIEGLAQKQEEIRETNSAIRKGKKATKAYLGK